ncbi:MAG: bifunctional demethylmenaquinone methyltransferase/2-methoxy-6-polyprenyl-1,4-benzoquinol methylase UbiE [Verrucomicrobia bacterium]|nr:bifunctional demethylmenaquinone methyltransferase/2-methoxy-6-polyprenyl-1,4-benzoquinol methylase UbiE [Verrucomicrobiota bacterium]
MGNVFFQPGKGRAAGVRDLFGGIAKRYDFLNDLQSFGLHRWWKRRLVKLAAPGPGKVMLDLCCGTGDVTFRLAAAGAAVVGVDFSEPMLAVARQRRRARGPDAKVVFVQGDALHIPFADDTFDAVTISYGLRNLAGVADGLREMWRVAKPGGRLLVLDFGKPDRPWWRSVYFAYLRWLVPVFGRVFARNSEAYAYILESLQHYPAQRGVARLMQELPARDVRVFNLLGGVMAINQAIKLPASRRSPA